MPSQTERRLQRRVSFGVGLDFTREGYARRIWGAHIPGMKYPDRVYGGKPLFRIPLSRWQPMRTDDDTPGQKVRL